MTAPVRAALYLRVATGRRAENDLCIPDQRRQAEGHCKSRGWEMAHQPPRTPPVALGLCPMYSQIGEKTLC